MDQTDDICESAIPTIDDRRLARLAKSIRPVMDLGRKMRFYTRVDPRTQSCIWNAPGGKEAVLVRKVGEPVTTLHHFSSSAFFKPSLAEVFAQMPEGIEGKANAFTIEFKDAETIRVEGGGLGSGHTFHRATVQFLQVRQI